MQRLIAASLLVFAIFAPPAHSFAERVKVEVVQTHTGVTLGANETEISDSDPEWTRCSGGSGIYSKEFGLHCGDASLVPEAAAAIGPGYAFFYDVTVIMPNRAHLVFHCSSILDHGCEGFPVYPESTRVVCSDFIFSGTVYKDCTATGPSAQAIGVYKAAVHGDRVTIFGSNWHRHFRQHGTWQFTEAAAQEKKPALLEEAPDAAPQPDAYAGPSREHGAKLLIALETHDPRQESKPAPAPAPDQDAKPAQPQEKADAPQETRTALAPGAGEGAKADTPASGGLSPSAAAEHAIDPQLIEHAKAGDPVAQYKLGYDYYLGQGVALDYVQAAIWWRKAAEQGCPDAQNNLGVLYNSGKGVPQSYAEAYFWQNLAAARASGSMQAQFAKNRDESGSKLWVIARLREQKRAAKWAAAHPVAPRSHEPKTERE